MLKKFMAGLIVGGIAGFCLCKKTDKIKSDVCDAIDKTCQKVSLKTAEISENQQ